MSFSALVRSFLILLVCCSVQAAEVFDSSGQIGSLDDLYGDIGGGSIFGSEPSLDFRAELAKAPENNPDNSDAYLVVYATIEPGWHLYTITQPPGGPLTGEFELEKSESLEQIGPFLTASEFHSEPSEVFTGIVEEYHETSATWIAPLKLKPNCDLDSATISGVFNGQICEIIVGSCVQISDKNFTAYFNPQLDVAPLLEAAEPNRSKTSQSGVAEYKAIETDQVDSFGMALVFAFFGGMILNVMPCVLPVIGLKILSFFDQAGQNRTKAFVLNLWYSLGLLSVFIVLAFFAVGLSKLFTFDLFNLIMICVVFAMALSLMDVWELRLPGFLGSGKSVELMEKEGAIGAFFKGIITTLLAIPCGAPLLSPALNWADTQIRADSTGTVFIVYSVIGIGMASPYLAIGAFPELLRFMPKPGMWMVTFKHVMGFMLLIAVVWILYFIPVELVVSTVALLFALWFACWLIGRLQLTATSSEMARAWFFGILVLILVILGSFNFKGNPNRYTIQNMMMAKLGMNIGKHWQPFTEQRLNQSLAQGQPVLVDFTADWCTSCKLFALAVLHTDEITALIDEKNVVSLEADCTKTDMEGRVFLRKYGSESVPALALFLPDNPTQPIIIRGGAYKKTVADLINRVTP